MQGHIWCPWGEVGVLHMVEWVAFFGRLCDREVKVGDGIEVDVVDC